jgi:DNA polymerase III delta prime subunit
MASDEQRLRLEQEKIYLEQLYNRQSDKINRLRNALIIETDPLRKFQYEQQIQQEENELKKLIVGLDEIENNLQSAQFKITNNRIISNSRQEYRIRNDVLNTISKEVDDLLNLYLPNGKQINLLKQSQPDLIWRQRIQNLNPSRRYSPYPLSNKSIIEVFLEHSGRLLIIGEAGSGKTITLLELAKYLVNEAKNDLNNPIPVVFNLSSWNNKNIEKWLVEQLTKFYAIYPIDALNLLKNSQIVPLLDDLDRLDVSQQSKCVKAINEFLSKFRPSYLVVCSCQGEYKNNPQLKVNGAITLHPLNEVQIHDYLVDIGRSQLWANIQDTPNILNLIKNPLFFFMMLRICEKDSNIKIWTRFYNDKEESIRFLFEQYIQEKLEESISEDNDLKTYTSREIKTWLKKIAINFKNEPKNYLLIEKIQPRDWLKSRDKKRMYFSLVALLTAITIYPIILSISVLFYEITKSNFIYSASDYKTANLILLLILSIVLGLIISVCNTEIKPVEIFKMPWREILNSVKLAGLKERLLNAFIANTNITNITERIENLKSIGSFWLNYLVKGMVGALIPLTAPLRESIFRLGKLGVFELQIEERNVVNQGIKNSAKNGLLGALIYGFLFFLIGLFIGLIINTENPTKIIGIYERISPGIIFGLVGLVFGGLFGGLLACIQHFTLRLILASHGDMPWFYIRFLNYATKQRLLQREGGRYRFIHPLLQKHFRTMDIR